MSKNQRRPYHHTKPKVDKLRPNDYDLYQNIKDYIQVFEDHFKKVLSWDDTIFDPILSSDIKDQTILEDLDKASSFHLKSQENYCARNRAANSDMWKYFNVYTLPSWRVR